MMLTNAEILLIATPIIGAALAACTSHFMMGGVRKRRAERRSAQTAKAIADAAKANVGSSTKAQLFEPKASVNS